VAIARADFAEAASARDRSQVVGGGAIAELAVPTETPAVRPIVGRQAAGVKGAGAHLEKANCAGDGNGCQGVGGRPVAQRASRLNPQQYPRLSVVTAQVRYEAADTWRNDNTCAAVVASAGVG
jgi:hypothetical protein